MSNNAALVTCRSIRRRNKEDRRNRELLLAILGNPWSLQDGRVEVDPDPAAPARYLPMVNPEVDAGPAVTKTRNEVNGRRIYITKKMVSEFGATLGCRGCLVIGQPHTETYVKPPHLRDTERCWLLKKCMYGTLPAAAGWQHLVHKVGADIGLFSSSSCPCAFGHSTRDLDMVVHGDDIIVTGDGDDLD